MRSNDAVPPSEPLPEAVIFSETLKRLRAEKKLTQQALAHDAGLAVNYMSDLERGRKVPSLTTVLQLAHALGVPPAELLSDFTPARVREVVKPHLR